MMRVVIIKIGFAGKLGDMKSSFLWEAVFLVVNTASHVDSA